MKPEELFTEIGRQLVSTHEEVTLGKMMSYPGIKYRNKVFAFFHANEMTFKLGKSFVPNEFGITYYSLLNPFKNKPPLAGWFRVPVDSAVSWKELANMAFDRIRLELNQ